MLSICFLLSSIAFTCFSPWSSIAFVCFSKALPTGEYADLDCSIIFPDDNTDKFAASLLMSYCNFSFLNLSSIVAISFYILSKRFFLKSEGLSDPRVASISKKEFSFGVHFYKDS